MALHLLCHFHAHFYGLVVKRHVKVSKDFFCLVFHDAKPDCIDTNFVYLLLLRLDLCIIVDRIAELALVVILRSEMFESLPVLFSEYLMLKAKPHVLELSV